MNFIPLTKPYVTSREKEAVGRVLDSGWWTTGPKVREFEAKFSDYIGKNVNSVALNSCTGGLFLALKALGIGKGDEVIVPTWTFVATAHVVLWTGAKIVLCDIDKATLNIDVKKLKRLINVKTKAIIPVHFAGLPCDMDELLNIAGKHNIKIIEDAAHAVGSKYNGKRIGAIGDIAVFSFYVTKNLACGEGGMVVSRNPGLIDSINKLSYFGIDKEAFKRYHKKGSWFYDVSGMGYKYNMDDIHASIGIEQLKKIESMNKKRREISEFYKKNLNRKINFQEVKRGKYHNYHLFIVKLPALKISIDDVISHLKEKNIGSGVHYIPLHKHSFYKRRYRRSDFTVADSLYGNVLSLPMFPSLKKNEIRRVCDVLNELVEKNENLHNC